MDALDIGILRTMGIDYWGRQPKSPDAFKPSRLAKVLGTTDETIRQRLRRLEAIGVLRGYHIIPNFQHLGLEATCYYFHFLDDAAADAAVKRLASLDGLIGTFTYTGAQMCANVAFRGPVDQQEKLRFLVEVAAGVPLLKYFDLDMPPVDRPLATIDWRIIQALRGNAVRPLEEAAAELGLSLRTVKRRFDRMAREGSFIVVPKLDLSRAEGMIPIGLNVHLGPEATRAAPNAVLKAVGDRLVSSVHPASTELGHVSLSLFAISVAEAEELRARVASVAGVAKADLGIVRGASGSFGWLKRAIEERLRATQPTAVTV